MPAEDRRLEGRLALVTGAAGRLGRFWTEALEDAGAEVAGIDLTGDGSIEAVDVADREAVESAVERIEAERGPIAIAINNAGIDQPPSADARTYAIEDVPAQDFLDTLSVNLLGTFNVIQSAGARMRDRGAGSIINIGSLYASTAPDPGFYDHMDADPPFLKPPAYGASKAGVVSLTRYFARLWGPAGVRVNALSPGGVEAGQDPEFIGKYSARVPLRRLARLEDLRGPMLFLASDDSQYVTGQNLQVDGGFTA